MGVAFRKPIPWNNRYADKNQHNLILLLKCGYEY